MIGSGSERETVKAGEMDMGLRASDVLGTGKCKFGGRCDNKSLKVSLCFSSDSFMTKQKGKIIKSK